jgi:DNA-binding NarL/FixJ family response regulator
MTGGTLVVSKAVNLHPHFKKRFEALGFRDVSITAVGKDGLNMLINDMNPRLVLIGAGFYQCATPYMMSLLLRQFPTLNIAALSLSDHPADFGMKFITNGVNSCVRLYDGIDQFYHGLDLIRNGKNFVSASIQERIEMRREMPMPARELTERQIEIIRLLCNGFSVDETSDCLAVSSRTVDAHKREIYFKLNVRNGIELVRVALSLELISKDELIFFGGNYELPPEVIKTPKNRRAK